MGKIRFDLPSGWQQKVIYKIKDNSVLKSVELIDMKTLKRYRPDCLQATAQKIILIFFFNPIVMFLKVFFNFVQIGFDYAKVTFDSGLDTVRALKSRNAIKLLEIFIISRIVFFKYAAEDIIAIVKAPIYALGIQLACVFMIFDALNGIKLISCFERGWNNNKSIKCDYRNSKEAQGMPLYKFLWKQLLSRDESTVFYLAPCFQPIGSLKDKCIVKYLDV